MAARRVTMGIGDSIATPTSMQRSTGPDLTVGTLDIITLLASTTPAERRNSQKGTHSNHVQGNNESAAQGTGPASLNAALTRCTSCASAETLAMVNRKTCLPSHVLISSNVTSRSFRFSRAKNCDVYLLDAQHFTRRMLNNECGRWAVGGQVARVITRMPLRVQLQSYASYYLLLLLFNLFNLKNKNSLCKCK